MQAVFFFHLKLVLPPISGMSKGGKDCFKFTILKLEISPLAERWAEPENATSTKMFLTFPVSRGGNILVEGPQPRGTVLHAPR